MRPGLPGLRDRHHDLPPCHLHRAVDRQPHDRAAARRAAGGAGHLRVPVRVAHGVHQPDRDPAVADRSDPGPRPDRHDHQRDGPGRAGGRDRGGRRRRDHRRGEHRAAPAAGARGGRQPIDVRDRARRLGRGAQRDHLRDRDQRGGDRPGLLPGGAVGLLLPAARPLLRPGGAGLDAGRAHRYAGALPAPPLQRVASAAGVTRCCGC